MSEKLNLKIPRPQRWDEPFDDAMSDEELDIVFKHPHFSNIDKQYFPTSIPLEGILLNDCRIRQFKAGDIVIREGDFGNSAFTILSGNVRMVVSPNLPKQLLGRITQNKKNFFQALVENLKSYKIPETRKYIGQQTAKEKLSTEQQHSNLYQSKYVTKSFDTDGNRFTLKPKYESIQLDKQDIFGVIAALSRTPRIATVYAETDTKILEIRWQGLREIINYNKAWDTIVKTSFRKSMVNHILKVKLPQNVDFSSLPSNVLDDIEREHKTLKKSIIFQSYGGYGWANFFQQSQKQEEIGSKKEPWVVREGEYVDSLLFVGAGFARISIKEGSGQRSLGFLSSGDHFGLYELYQGWKENKPLVWKTSLSALGYVQILHIPVYILQQYVFPEFDKLEKIPKDYFQLSKRPLAADDLLTWAIENRYINGTKTMVIDQDKCVHCDDCVSACARGHDGNPRFIRNGETKSKWLITHACMHCTDPVCMIGCPTGAIHRTQEGTVVINDATCIGCESCANACPYNNIQMVSIRDNKGHSVLGNNDVPIIKATKCDLCDNYKSGPACVRACAHGALQRIDFKESDWWKKI